MKRLEEDHADEFESTVQSNICTLLAVCVWNDQLKVRERVRYGIECNHFDFHEHASVDIPDAFLLLIRDGEGAEIAVNPVLDNQLALPHLCTRLPQLSWAGLILVRKPTNEEKGLSRSSLLWTRPRCRRGLEVVGIEGVGLSDLQLMEQSQNEHIRGRVQKLEGYFKAVDEEITCNMKLFDDTKLENKQAYESINRNLDDLKEIYDKDLTKYEETVDKSIGYNEALFQRVEKDAHYLSDDQDGLRRKLLLLEKRIEDMEHQIGNMEY